jgi:hypothetical protein
MNPKFKSIKTLAVLSRTFGGTYIAADNRRYTGFTTIDSVDGFNNDYWCGTLLTCIDLTKVKK